METLNTQQTNRRGLIALVAFMFLLVATFGLVSGGGAFRDASAQSGNGRKVNVRHFNETPVKVKEIRNLQKSEGWFRDLEVEVQNVSDRPVYFIYVVVSFPDAEAVRTAGPDGNIPSKKFALMFGEPRLGDLSNMPLPADKPLNPGDTYVLKFPDYMVRSFESKQADMTLPPWATNRVEVEVQSANFGDGTGYHKGRMRERLKERELTKHTFKDMPVEFKEVRNLQNGEDWLRDLTVEVRNVSDKPIYFMEISIEFPNVPAPAPTPRPDNGFIPRAVTGFGIAYGDYRLIDVRELAGPDDVPLKPGETYVFKVPESRVTGFESMKKDKKNLSPKIWNKIVIEFGNISFGDGTGFIGGRKVSYSKKVGAKPAGRKPAPPFVSKVNWVRPARASPLPALASVAAIPQTSGCPSGCDRYFIETDADTASCIDSSTPPKVCPRPVAKIRPAEQCSIFGTEPFPCGANQPCQRDKIDQQNSELLCRGCKDDDGDGWTTCSGDCDDSDFNINPRAEERCGNGKDDNCDPQHQVDEQPCCDNSDHDNDDVSICDGDCDDNNDNLIYDCSPTPTPTPPPPPQHCVINWVVAAWCDGYDFDTCYCPSDINKSPVIVDVLGDGFRLTDAARGALFDLDGDGTPERISWTSTGSDDAFLALDRDGDGRIGNGQELFGNFTPQHSPPPGEVRNGFLALAEFDRPAAGGNSDGVISDADAVFTSLRLWRDSNHNGVSEPGELHTLPGLGLRTIELDYKESKRADEYGNRFRYRAKVRDVHGAQLGRWAWDVFLVPGN